MNFEKVDVRNVYAIGNVTKTKVKKETATLKNDPDDGKKYLK